MRNVADLRKEIETQFGTTLTARQLWALVKLAKHVRLRCRNNAAFNNCMNALFNPHATFRQIQKIRTSGPYAGQSYPGLSIDVQGDMGGADPVDESEE
jgi:hypothetical protein